MRKIDEYLWIRKAALLIAYDNGMVNRHHTEHEFLENTEGVLGSEGVTEEELRSLDAFLGSLSEEDLETICNGEHSEMQEIEKKAPTGGPDDQPLTFLLNDIFDG